MHTPFKEFLLSKSFTWIAYVCQLDLKNWLKYSYMDGYILMTILIYMRVTKKIIYTCYIIDFNHFFVMPHYQNII